MSEENAPKTDHELQAMIMIAKYLGQVDRGGAQRILKWAEARYVHEPLPQIDMDGFEKFFASLAEVAKELGNVAPIDVLRAALEIIRVRDEQRANDPDVEGAA